MSIRLQWFKVSPFSGRDLKRLSDRLLSEKYGEERGWGFDIAEVRRDHFTGRYIVKEKRVESFRDPQGEIQTLEFNIFNETEFRIQIASPQLELRSPSRGVMELFNLFGEFLDYRIAITAVTLDPIQWAKNFQKNFELVTVHKAVISNITMSSTVAATVTLAGTEDVQKYFAEIVSRKKYVVESATIAFSDSGSQIKFEVNRAGRIKILSADESHAAKFFRDRVSEFG